MSIRPILKILIFRHVCLNHSPNTSILYKNKISSVFLFIHIYNNHGIRVLKSHLRVCVHDVVHCCTVQSVRQSHFKFVHIYVYSEKQKANFLCHFPWIIYLVTTPKKHIFLSFNENGTLFCLVQLETWPTGSAYCAMLQPELGTEHFGTFRNGKVDQFKDLL